MKGRSLRPALLLLPVVAIEPFPAYAPCPVFGVLHRDLGKPVLRKILSHPPPIGKSCRLTEPNLPAAAAATPRDPTAPPSSSVVRGSSRAIALPVAGSRRPPGPAARGANSSPEGPPPPMVVRRSHPAGSLNSCMPLEIPGANSIAWRYQRSAAADICQLVHVGEVETPPRRNRTTPSFPTSSRETVESGRHRTRGRPNSSAPTQAGRAPSADRDELPANPVRSSP